MISKVEKLRIFFKPFGFFVFFVFWEIQKPNEFLFLTGGGVPSILQEVQVPIMENSVCQEMFLTTGHQKRILDSFLCAGYANGQKDSCEV